MDTPPIPEVYTKAKFNPEDEIHRIRNVWKGNLYEEFVAMREIAKDYPFIALDTEFPGVVIRPIGEFLNLEDYQYTLLKSNVDVLKLIQLGFTFFDGRGETPPGVCSWQFNFNFSLSKNTYAESSIQLLIQAGIDFAKHESEGILPSTFAEFCITSGLLVSFDYTWLTFHSMYDFGYLIKIFMNKPLPADEIKFLTMLQIFFPVLYDLKLLMKLCKFYRGGLQALADQLQIERVGQQHQAGSDSWLTGLAYFRLKNIFWQYHSDYAKYAGRLYGIRKSGKLMITSNTKEAKLAEMQSLPPFNDGS